MKYYVMYLSQYLPGMDNFFEGALQAVSQNGSACHDVSARNRARWKRH